MCYTGNYETPNRASSLHAIARDPVFFIQGIKLLPYYQPAATNFLNFFTRRPWQPSFPASGNFAHHITATGFIIPGKGRASRARPYPGLSERGGVSERRCSAKAGIDTNRYGERLPANERESESRKKDRSCKRVFAARPVRFGSESCVYLSKVITDNLLGIAAPTVSRSIGLDRSPRNTDRWSREHTKYLTSIHCRRSFRLTIKES